MDLEDTLCEFIVTLKISSRWIKEKEIKSYTIKIITLKWKTSKEEYWNKITRRLSENN